MAYDSRPLGSTPFAAADPPSGVLPRPGDPPRDDHGAADAAARLRAEAARLVREGSQSEVGVFAVVGRASDGIRVLDSEVDAEPEVARLVARALAAHPVVESELGAFASAWKTAFVSRSGVLRARREASRDGVPTDPLGAGIAVTDWVGLWVCSGRQLVAWVGALRLGGSRPHGPGIVRGLARFVPQVSALALDAHALAREACGERGEVFLGPTGVARCASPAGRRWLEREENVGRLAAAARHMIRGGVDRLEVPLRGGTARLVRMSGDGDDGIFAELAPPVLVEHAATSDLTPAQLRVAALAAHGASAQQIALAIGSTEGTVRVHLRDVFRRLGVASRLELAKVLGA